MELMSVDAGALAHSVHYGVLVIGLVGILALLGPSWVGGSRRQPPRDDHERRVRALQQQISSGGIALLAPPVSLAPPRPRTQPRGALVPLAVLSSTAAAGAHAAVGPAHFRELLLFGLFFCGSALAQIAWASAMVLAPSRRLLLAGLLGNTALIGLWLATRTVGLPFGLMPTPEAVGAWDVACVAWEGVVVVACARLLQTGERDLRLAGPASWPRSAQTWTVVSVLALGLLTVSGAGA